MNIMVIGAGYLGRKIAEILDRSGHEIVIIEENEENLSSLSSKFGGIIFQSFPMDVQNLRNAGIESCDAVAVTTSDDNLNITVGQIAKDIFNVETVVTRISDPFREYIFESFGLQSVCPTNMSAESIINAITTPYEQKKVSFGTNLVTFRLSDIDKKDIGKRIAVLEGSEEESVFGVVRENGKFFLNTAFDCPIAEAGDKLVIAKKTD